MSEYENLPVSPETADRVEELIQDGRTPYETRDELVSALLSLHDHEPVRVDIEKYRESKTEYLWPDDSLEIAFDSGLVEIQR